MRGIKYTAKEKLKALKLWRQDHKDILWVAKKMKCTERSLWRWLSQYDGNLKSLENASSKPHTRHPNAHTNEEREAIEQIFKNNPSISYTEALGKLRLKIAYKRTYFGFWRYVVKNNLRPKPVEEHNPYIPQPYNTPEMLGMKWQMDVKYVPQHCNKTKYKDRYFQYTMIDEATRERFLFAYNEISANNTVDFVKRAIIYYGYFPKRIQTDNGPEFTNTRAIECKSLKKHALDIFLDKINVEHQLIRAYTPRHNGKVERSHRSDNEGFYKYLQFATFEELRAKMRKWNATYNSRPHSSLRDVNGKRIWQSPLEKREELMGLLKSGNIQNFIDCSKFELRFFTKYKKEMAYSY